MGVNDWNGVSCTVHASLTYWQNCMINKKAESRGQAVELVSSEEGGQKGMCNLALLI